MAKTTPKKKLTPTQLMHEDTIAQIEANRTRIIGLQNLFTKGKAETDSTLRNINAKLNRIDQSIIAMRHEQYALAQEAEAAASPSLEKGKEWEEGLSASWVRGQIKRWEEHAPTDDQEGDTEATRLARADLRAVMDKCGWDIYGGSSDDVIVAMNYAWNEGFLDAREQTYRDTISAKKIEEEQRVVELQKQDWTDATEWLIGELKALNLPFTADNEDTFDWALEHGGIYWSEREIPQLFGCGLSGPALAGKKLSGTEFLRRAQGTADRLKKLEAEKERNRVPEFGDRVKFNDEPPFGDAPCEEGYYIGTVGKRHMVAYKHPNDPTITCTYTCARSEFTILNP